MDTINIHVCEIHFAVVVVSRFSLLFQRLLEVFHELFTSFPRLFSRVFHAFSTRFSRVFSRVFHTFFTYVFHTFFHTFSHSLGGMCFSQFSTFWSLISFRNICTTTVSLSCPTDHARHTSHTGHTSHTSHTGHTSQTSKNHDQKRQQTTINSNAMFVLYISNAVGSPQVTLKRGWVFARGSCCSPWVWKTSGSAAVRVASTSVAMLVLQCLWWFVYDLGTELKVGMSVAGRGSVDGIVCRGRIFFRNVFLLFSCGIHSADFLTL